MGSICVKDPQWTLWETGDGDDRDDVTREATLFRTHGRPTPNHLTLTRIDGLAEATVALANSYFPLPYSQPYPGANPLLEETPKKGKASTRPPSGASHD